MVQWLDTARVIAHALATDVVELAATVDVVDVPADFANVLAGVCRELTVRCKHPYRVGQSDTLFPCGRCAACRITSARVWTTRQILESYGHDENCFVTLTYAPEHLPRFGTLDPEDLRLFLKNLRQILERERNGQKVRYFACGEYGPTTERPHYHVNLFGLSAVEKEIIHRAWSKGHVSAFEFNAQRARYLTGYVTKNKTREGDMGEHRFPEFARMSTKPGLGLAALSVVLDAIGTQGGTQELEQKGDVPAALRVGGTSLPLGRYLLNKLRDSTFTSEVRRQQIKDRYFGEMYNRVLQLRESTGDYETCPAVLVAKDNFQHNVNLETREKIKRSQRTL
jgi:hypothetical protein